ncbi:hypothetical protein J3R82DRAFT_5713 [Butyriboletus roseoflavus]|nr:hypothetical protein J3R82DRAFT_5713 [Butyriboletus roseoflavus]
MDPSAPRTVLKGVVITCEFVPCASSQTSLGGVAGGFYGGFKHGAPTKFLLYSAVNSGIVAATFFSIREYVISPVLVSMLPGSQYQLRRQRLSLSVGQPMSEEAAFLSWADIRTSRLLDSGVSGGLAGGILNVWKRALGHLKHFSNLSSYTLGGRRGLTPGVATGALMCTLVQWCFNEFNILRIHYVSGNSAALAQHTTHSSVDAGQSSPAEFSTPVAMQPASVGSPTSHSPKERMLSMFGQRISDEKYLERLKMERDFHLRRIAELEERKKH